MTSDEVADAEWFPCLGCGAAASQPCRPLPSEHYRGPMSSIASRTDGSGLIEVECRRHGLVMTTGSVRVAELADAVHHRCRPKPEYRDAT